MTAADLVASSLQSLSRTKGRSVLTMFGIVVGVMSVIMMLSVGEAAQRFILNQISSFGSDVLFVANGAEVEEGQPTLFVKESLTLKDVTRMRTLPWITTIAGKLFQDDQVTGQGIETKVQVVGTMPDELRLSDVRVGNGVFFTMSSVDGHAREAVLGNDVADALFGQENPIGKSVKINEVSFRVIGVIQKSGTKAFQNVDKQVYLPLTSAMDAYNKKFLTYIQLRTTLVNLNEAKDRIRAFMRDRHNIDNPEGDLAKDDFHVHTQEDLIRSVSNITNILQILLISIAAISLLVGGIGIMNIMYVSVTERTREIGLRKSIGARKSDILRQFIVEAVIQTMIGGIVGTVLGLAFTWIGIQVISRFQEGWAFSPSWNGMLLGPFVSAAIGIVFGYFPARRAAVLNPIDALRFE